MTTIKLTGFQGIIPKLSKRLLPDSAAQVANNVKLASGELVPYRQTNLTHTPNKPLPVVSMFRAVFGAASAWMTWPSDVDVVRAPFDKSVEPLYCWTGDGIPRCGKYTDVSSGGGNDYPHTSYALGLPNPVTKPSVATSGGTLSPVNRMYCYTFMNALKQETGPSAFSDSTVGKPDGSWSITNMDAFPANSGTGTATYASGVTTFANSGAHWLRAGDQVVLGAASVTVASVPDSTHFTVAGDYHLQTAWSRTVPWNTAGLVRRLYRTAGTAADFQLVVETTATSYNDILADTAIPGDSLITSGWQPPPVNLKGLFVTAFGSLAGFADNILYVSEPLQPHTFPAAYQRSADYDIVSARLSGSDIVVATTANPYVAQGNGPDTLQMQKLPANLPCLSKRSLVSDGKAAYYVSKFGVVAVQSAQADVITGAWFTDKEWSQFEPESMICAFCYGRLIVSLVDAFGLRRMLVFNFLESLLTTLDLQSYGLYTDETTGTLYLGTTRGVEEFDYENGYPLQFEWHSKEIVLPKPENLGAAQVVFESGLTDEELAVLVAQRNAVLAQNAANIAAGLVTGGIGRVGYGRVGFGRSNALVVPDLPAFNYITFTLYNKDRPVFSRTCYSTTPFRLPAGYKTDRISVKLNGQCQGSYVIMASTMAELGQA